MKIFKLIKQMFCLHIYGDGVMNPFTDIYDHNSAIYTCTKCGHRYFKTFERK